MGKSEILLNARLTKISRFILDDFPLFDIGCDHGLVGLHARSVGRVPEIYLVDKSKKVMDILKKRCEHYLTEDTKRHFIHVDARNWRLPHSSGTLVISGMGGRTIEAILHSLFAKTPMNHRLILSPIKTCERLREYLSEQGWGLFHEEIMVERGRFRELIVVEKTGRKIEPFGSFLFQKNINSINEYREFVKRINNFRH